MSEMALSKARQVYDTLKNTEILNDMKFTSLEAAKNGDLFEILVATILSQNTSDRNSIEAYERLRQNIRIEPSEIMNANIREIEKYIRKAGLYKSKARAIKESAELIMYKLNGDLRNIRKYPLDKAREILSSINGVGLKTADVVLLHLGFPVFPVDTHIRRVSKRLGIVGEKADYEEISNVWKKALKPHEYLDAHLRLIAFGRRICLAKNPKCGICFFKDICVYVKKNG